MRLAPTSLRSRLLLAASLILSAFFVLTGFALENAFRASALQAQEDKLEGLVYALLSAATPNEDDVLTITTNAIRDQRLLEPASGVRAALFDDRGQAVWRSASFIEVAPPRPVDVGQWRFEQASSSNLFSISYGVRYIDAEDDPNRYVVVVVDDATSYFDQLKKFRRSLFGWLAAAGLGLLLAQALTLRWSLSPMSRLVSELRSVETGARPEIIGDYPDELEPLTEGLNAMIRNERSQQVRYRNALGDLAHSLKTPLAVIHGVSEDATLAVSAQALIREQVSNMRQITDYQLRKAATAGRRTLSEPIAVEPIIAKLTHALSKVYAGKNTHFRVSVTPGLRLRADSGDLFELLGNLLDNAAKYGRGQVALAVSRDGGSCVFRIEDDGPGFPEQAETLLQRGVRADMQKPGQGIGLAAVRELVEAYQGAIELGASDLGGGLVTIRLPS